VLQKWEPLKNRKDLDAPEREGGVKLPSEAGLSGPKGILTKNQNFVFCWNDCDRSAMSWPMITKQNPRDRSTGI
jgi:hypothetical protein